MEKNVLEQQRSSSVYEWYCREHCGRQSAPGMQLRMLLRNSELASESYPTRKYCPGRQVRCQGAMRSFRRPRIANIVISWSAQFDLCGGNFHGHAARQHFQPQDHSEFILA